MSNQQQPICASKFCYLSSPAELTPEDLKQVQITYCPKCNEVKYCSQRCQKQDSYTHQRTCKNMSDSQSVSTLSSNKKSLEDYEVLPLPGNKQELGRGSYGAVKLVKEKKSGQKFAMKIISKNTIFKYCSVENLKREIKIQKRLSHSHITKLHHYFEDKQNVYLVLEYAENGSLFQFIRKKKFFPENEAFIYFFQTCLGIDYLHKKGIIHRDLKPENLLLDSESNIKLCDFGWSAEAMNFQKRTTFCGTIDYMSPEMIKNEPHDHTLDIWCLGILLFELIHGHAPYQGQNDHQVCQSIVNGTKIQFNPRISRDCQELVLGILKQNPKQRLTMNQIFNHPWMASMARHYNIQLEQYIYRESSSSQKSSEYLSKSSVPAEKQNISPQSNIKDQKYNNNNYEPYLKKYNIDQNRDISLFNKLDSQLEQSKAKEQYYQSDFYNVQPQPQSNMFKSQQYTPQQPMIKKNQYNKYLDDDDTQFKARVSRVSQRNNYQDSNNQWNKYNSQPQKTQEEEGFFNKILSAFGCINRDNKNIPKESNMMQKNKN